MKKILIAFLIAIQSATAVYAQTELILPEATNDFIYTQIPSEQTEAEPSASPEVTEKPLSTPTPADKLIANTFTANFRVEGEGYNVKKDIVFALYDGDMLIDEVLYRIEDDIREFCVTFDTPEYKVGKQFSIVCVEGAEGMRYYEDVYGVGELVSAPTYAYTDKNGVDVVVTETAMNILTEKEKTVNIYVDGKQLLLKSEPRIINNTVMVPVRELSEALGVFDVTYNPDYESVRVSAVEGKETLFNIGYPWTTVDGVNRVDEVSTIYIGANVYVPVKTLADGVASTIEFWEHEKYIDILLSRSKHVVNYIDKVNYINSQKLTSKTDYLIWISKANYEVNVFKNSGGIWNFMNSYRCAIGTNETPTCVGTYRYYERIEKWTYPEFYVGPVMRFNGGYAIHSTLLKFDGTDYNRAVGKKLSHGCVRVQPPDMEWLIENIPMYTTVHVTDI